MSNYLKTSIQFKKRDRDYISGELLEAEISFTPFIDLKINRIEVQISYTARGQMEPENNIVDQLYFLKGQDMYANETVSFPLAFRVGGPNSYIGKNVEIIWQIGTVISLQNETKSQIRKESLSTLSLLKAYDPEKSLSYREVFEVAGAGDYMTSFQKIILERKINGSYYLIAFVIGFFFVIFSKSMLLGLFIMIAFCIIGAIDNLVKVYIGSITAKMEHVDDQSFEVVLDFSQNNYSFVDAELQYNVEEKVTDDRGTSTTTHNEEIFAAKEIHIKLNKSKFLFNYPEESIPTNVESQNVQINWNLLLHFEFAKFIPVTMKSEFIVIKMPSSQDSSVVNLNKKI